MGVSQTNQSFQNDGNFSQLDLLNVQYGGPLMRLETFRCSHPEGDYGITAAGTPVTSLAGKDHLSDASNRTFRMIFSYGQMDSVIALLEMREYYQEDGSASLYVRDIDGRNSSFGTVLSTHLNPREDGVTLQYKILEPGTLSKKVLRSPYYEAPTKQVEGLTDLAEVETLQAISKELSIDLILGGDNSKALSDLSAFSESVSEQYPNWAANAQVYQRMGDFRDKCIHHATNLIGKNPLLASEFIVARNYRWALIIGGYTFDPQMRAGARTIRPNEPLSLDTKPGVYSVFLSAYAMNIGLYQLGIDKVHSDYGGVPMALRPGSRLENGATPVADSTNFNRLLALVSAFLYAPDALPSLAKAKPQILLFGVRHSLPVFERSVQL